MHDEQDMPPFQHPFAPASLLAALKSLPFAPEADEASSSSGDEHLHLAQNLLAQCESMLQGLCST